MTTANEGATLPGRVDPAPREPVGGELEETVRSLESQLARRKRRRILRTLLGFVLLAGAAGGAFAYRRAHAPPPEPRFTLGEVELREILEEVQATGVVEPLHRVEVGAQVSGRVVRVLVDFNDRVQEGQLLAEIDPALFGADVVQTGAQLESAVASVGRAKAAREAARVRLSRLRALVAEGAASAAELDQAQADFDMAEAEVGSADAQRSQIAARLRSANTTLKYTKIQSPIDGVVIDRRIEPGQTVAASFNTPVLFDIARDLTKMRVLAEIDEADVGKIKEGMAAEVVVDAFPAEQFTGALTQIRLSPNKVEGVVTYGAVIIVDNPKGLLRPGMTATATVTTERVEGAVAVKNAALRFQPLARDRGKDSPVPKKPEEARPGPGAGRIYQVASGPPEDPQVQSRIIDLGITDGVWTVVRGGLQVGDQVIIDEKPPGEQRGFRLF